MSKRKVKVGGAWLEAGPDAPVTICQLDAEFSEVLRLFREERPARLLELGTAEGGTLYHWLTEGSGFLDIVVSVDWDQSDYPLDQDLAASWADGTTLALVQGDTHDPQTLQHVHDLGAPFDWLFIDGAHVYEDSKADWDDYRALVKDGGLVLLHDIALRRVYPDGREAGVHRLWQEIRAAGYWTREIRARPNLDEYGIGIVRV